MVSTLQFPWIFQRWSFGAVVCVDLVPILCLFVACVRFTLKTLCLPLEQAQRYSVLEGTETLPSFRSRTVGASSKHSVIRHLAAMVSVAGREGVDGELLEQPVCPVVRLQHVAG